MRGNSRFLHSGLVLLAYLLVSVINIVCNIGFVLLMNRWNLPIPMLLLFDLPMLCLWVGFFFFVRSRQRGSSNDSYSWKPGACFYVAVLLLVANLVISVMLRYESFTLPIELYTFIHSSIVYALQSSLAIVLPAALLLTAYTQESGKPLLAMLCVIGAIGAALTDIVPLVNSLASGVPIAVWGYVLHTASQLVASVSLFIAAALLLRLMQGRLPDALALFAVAHVLLQIAGYRLGGLLPASWDSGIASDFMNFIVYAVALAAFAALLAAQQKGATARDAAGWIKKLRTFGVEKD